jgi:hypothetical protein
LTVKIDYAALVAMSPSDFAKAAFSVTEDAWIKAAHARFGAIAKAEPDRPFSDCAARSVYRFHRGAGQE